MKQQWHNDVFSSTSQTVGCEIRTECWMVWQSRSADVRGRVEEMQKWVVRPGILKPRNGLAVTSWSSSVWTGLTFILRPQSSVSWQYVSVNILQAWWALGQFVVQLHRSIDTLKEEETFKLLVWGRLVKGCLTLVWGVHLWSDGDGYRNEGPISMM